MVKGMIGRPGMRLSQAGEGGLTRLPRYWRRPRISLVPMLALCVTKHWEGTPMWESLARLTSLYRSVPARHQGMCFEILFGCQHLPSMGYRHCIATHKLRAAWPKPPPNGMLHLSRAVPCKS